MSDTENIVRDIFGDSDESDDEFEGFEGETFQSKINKKKNAETVNDITSEKLDFSDSSDLEKFEENDELKKKSKEKLLEVSDDSDDGSVIDHSDEKQGMIYDFDVMLQKKKEMTSRKRQRKNVDIINDDDDIIADLIKNMRAAAEEDFEQNRNQKTATRKLKMLPQVENQLKKIDLREALLDSGILYVITDWLTRLPDGSLPHLKIRETLLKILVEFNIDDIDRIKSSSIGKAVMLLFKHPKETKENKRLANQLIVSWSRPIFNLDTNFYSISKDEREKRDFEHMAKSKQNYSDYGDSTPSKNTKNNQKIVRPGEKGWVPRARVPMPSMKDYVIRPRSTVELDLTRINSNKKSANRFEKHMRNFREMKKINKANRAVPISIEGRKMAL